MAQRQAQLVAHEELVQAEEDVGISSYVKNGKSNVNEHTDTDSSENDENPAIFDVEYPWGTSDITSGVIEEPDSTPTVPNFSKLLEDRITAYRHEKYSSEKAKKGYVTLSNKEVNKFLKKAKVKCIALYSKKVASVKRLQSHTHSVQNTMESNSKHSNDDKSKLEQKSRKKGRSRVSVLVGGASVREDIKACNRQEKKHNTCCEQTAKMNPHKDIGGEETDACTNYYDAVGQFNVKVEGSYKIEYSWISSQPSDPEYVAVKELPDVEFSGVQAETESQVRQLHFTSFVQCTVKDDEKIN